jgi:proteasome assembly chaperone (PAC2) family protein
MEDLVNIWKKPPATEIFMLAGWHQWADAGSISSGLPQYLIDHLGAEKIGEISPDGFYLFQLPGTHHLMRPEIQMEEGYRKTLHGPRNEFYYAGDEERGLVIFLGEEPHLNVFRYAELFFDAVETLGVKRVIGLGGVYGALPFDKDRDISCVYSLPQLKQELSNYVVRFSNYEGGATIGAVLVDRAEPRDVEFVDFYGFVPAYDFSEVSNQYQGLRIEDDFKAWYDLMRRFNHMFNLGIDLSDLEGHSEDLLERIEREIDDLAQKEPQLNVRSYLAGLAEDFTEMSFMPLDDVWERELGDLFDDSNE